MESMLRVQAFARAWLGREAGAARWLLLVAAFVGILAAVLLVPVWLDFVAVADAAVPQPEMTRDYLSGVAWAVVLGLAVAAFPLPRAHRQALLVAWGAKVAVVLGFMLLYEARYQGSLDAIGYFVHSADGVFVWTGFRLNHGTENLIHLAWLHGRILPHSYHTLKVSFAFLGLAGIYLFYRAYSLFLRRDDLRALFVLALVPSVLFWSSVLGKDPVVLFALGAVAWGTVGFARCRAPRHMVGLVAGMVILALFRPWLAVIAAIAVAVLPLRAVVRLGRGVKGHLAAALLGVGVIGAGVLLLAGLLGVSSVDGAVTLVNALARAWAYGGSGQTPPEFHALSDLLLFLPWGMFTALFRPLPGEITDPLLFGTLAGTENVLLLSAVALAAVRSRRGDFREPLLVVALVFVAIWASLYAFISYQNLGSGLRFRLQVLPVFLGIILWLARPRNEAFSSVFAWLPAPFRSWPRRTARAMEAVLAAGVAAVGLILVAAAALVPARRGTGRRLLVLDTSYTLRELRSRGLEQAVLSRDLDGYFERVWSVHPLVGADRRGPDEHSVGSPVSTNLGPRHLFVEGRIAARSELRRLPILNFALAQTELLLFLNRLMRKERISLVRASDPYWPGLLALLLARVHGRPFVLRVGGNYDAIHAMLGTPAYPRLFRQRRIEKAVERIVFPRVDLVLGANDDNLRYALANGARPERATVVRYGSLLATVHFGEPSARPSQKVRDELDLGDDPYIAYVGRLEAVKHPGDVLRVLAALRPRHPRLHAVLVGDGRMRKELEALARELGVADAVHMPGNRDQGWVAACFADASVVVSPHMGRALVEAALSGRPIVAYDLDWQGELVRSGETGIIVPAHDWKAMAEATGMLLEDAEAARALGRRGRAEALEAMDPAALMERERRSYEALQATPGPGVARR